MFTTGNIVRYVSLLLVAFGLSSCQTTDVGRTLSIPKVQDSEELFQGPVRNVLEHRCIHCHNNNVSNGGMNLQNRSLIFAGDSKGPFIVPGEPEQSRIWKAIIRPQKHHNAMPADGWGLSTDDLRCFLSWIERGADWPEGKEGELQIRNYEVEMDELL